MGTVQPAYVKKGKILVNSVLRSCHQDVTTAPKLGIQSRAINWRYPIPQQLINSSS
jgi:hypothetical protein